MQTTRVLIARLTKGKLLRFYCEARLAAGLKLPVSWRWWYLEPLYMRASRDYMPEPIQCRLVLIQSRENASRRTIWAGLTTGEFRAHDIEPPEPWGYGGRWTIHIAVADFAQAPFGAPLITYRT